MCTGFVVISRRCTRIDSLFRLACPLSYFASWMVPSVQHICSFHTLPCDSVRSCGISRNFFLLSPCMRQVFHALLTRPPLSTNKNLSIASYFDLQRLHSVRLACVRHAASVHPEPGSNSRRKISTLSSGLVRLV